MFVLLYTLLFQESNLMGLLLTIDPNTPEFLTEIVLTYVATNFDNIKDMVS